MTCLFKVHPDDQFANEFENDELGKTECWYIIDYVDYAEVIFGHKARSNEELRGKIENGERNDLLQRINIKPGDFFYVPSGTIHALCKGTLELETQQSAERHIESMIMMVIIRKGIYVNFI